MKRIWQRLKLFFFPPPGTARWLRILPYAVLGVLTLLLFTGGAYAWDYTNSPPFCGETCHTMPPEYTAYLTSPHHARIDCVDCHIGKGFIATRITRKAGDAKHIFSLVFKDYEFPIHADDLRPARETCELCHFPQKFSDDSLREIKRFANDRENTPVSIYLTMKTGGGSKRAGLGRGIHWHIENKVHAAYTGTLKTKSNTWRQTRKSSTSHTCASWKTMGQSANLLNWGPRSTRNPSIPRTSRRWTASPATTASRI